MEKKKRIVFLSRYVGVVDRGVETYVLELSKRLKHDFDVEIFSNETSDDLRRFKRGEKIDFGLEKPVVLSVGALDWYKYHELAIKAVSRMRKGSLLIVGRGQLKKQLEDLGKRMLGNRFKIAEFDFNDPFLILETAFIANS